MEGLIFKRANTDEIELMTKARVDYCMRESPTLDNVIYEAFYKSVENWTKRNVLEGNYLGYFGYLFEDLASFAGLLLNELPPIVNQNNRTQGYVLSFFTYPQFRKRGIGTEMMDYITKDAKKMGLSRLALIATEEGIPLYRKCGFSEPKMLYMEKSLLTH